MHSHNMQYSVEHLPILILPSQDHYRSLVKVCQSAARRPAVLFDCVPCSAVYDSCESCNFIHLYSP